MADSKTDLGLEQRLVDRKVVGHGRVETLGSMMKALVWYTIERIFICAKGEIGDY